MNNREKQFEEIGLYYFNARWYDADLGRFTTEDPARDGVNWFVYCGNNPLGFVDPTGLIDVIADDVDGEALTFYDDYVEDLNVRIDRTKREIRESTSIVEAQSLELQRLEYEGSLPIDFGDFRQTDKAYNDIARLYGEQGLKNPGRYACAFLSSMYHVFNKIGHLATRTDLKQIASLSFGKPGNFPEEGNVLTEDYDVGDFYSLMNNAMNRINGNFKAAWPRNIEQREFGLRIFNTSFGNEHFSAIDSSGNMLFNPDPSISTPTIVGEMYFRWVKKR